MVERKTLNKTNRNVSKVAACLIDAFPGQMPMDMLHARQTSASIIYELAGQNILKD